MPPPRDTRLKVSIFCGDAVLGDLEVRRGQVGDRPAVAVAHDHVHEDRGRGGGEGLRRRAARARPAADAVPRPTSQQRRRRVANGSLVMTGSPDS